MRSVLALISPHVRCAGLVAFLTLIFPAGPVQAQDAPVPPQASADDQKAQRAERRKQFDEIVDRWKARKAEYDAKIATFKESEAYKEAIATGDPDLREKVQALVPEPPSPDLALNQVLALIDRCDADEAMPYILWAVFMPGGGSRSWAAFNRMGREQLVGIEALPLVERGPELIRSIGGVNATYVFQGLYDQSRAGEVKAWAAYRLAELITPEEKKGDGIDRWQRLLATALRYGQTSDIAAKIEHPGFAPLVIERGQKLIDIGGHAIGGGTVVPSDLEGKVYALVFTDDEDPLCVAQYGYFARLQKELEGEPFQLVGISVDVDPAVVQRRIDSGEITWPVLHAGNWSYWDQYPVELHVTECPTVVLFDAEARYRGHFNIRTDHAWSDLESQVHVWIDEIRKQSAAGKTPVDGGDDGQKPAPGEGG